MSKFKKSLILLKCRNFFCKNEFNLDKNNHLLIIIGHIDNYCFKDNEKYTIYSKTHNISLCADCEHKDNK